VGWVSPAEFISVAEERGLIIALGDWSLDAAARQWRAWSSAGIAQPPVIAVNVSAAQMMSDSFSERAMAIMRARREPTMHRMEITESALMHDPAKAKRVASQLVEQGFTLSIDDFGTGYSSLARLQSFPVSRLKIDMSFVRGMLSEPGSLAIVTAVIG
jgi:EAL domain-containing protein (putative c-di-GMP-specific phosphodiesterase class I)